MKIEIVLNGVHADISDQKVKIIFQVNDFADLKSRQSSFSEQIKLMPTGSMLKMLDLLGSYPNNSRAPYRRISTDYIVDGIPIVLDAFGMIKNTDEVYNFHFYDGNIDLYRAIEQLKLTDLPFDEFKHIKNIEGVKNTWENDLPYVYAVADYGGIIEYNGALNIDFLVPSISMKWVWDKIFEITGFQYYMPSNVLENKYFTISDAYKDVSAEGTFDRAVDYSEKFETAGETLNPYLQKYVAPIMLEDPLVEDNPDVENWIYTAQAEGYFDLSFICEKQYPAILVWFMFGLPDIALVKNPNPDPMQITEIIPGSVRSYEFVDFDGDVPYYKIDARWNNIWLEAGETIAMVAIKDSQIVVFDIEPTYQSMPTNIVITYKPEAEVSLPEYLSDLPIKELFQEVLIQNALTPIVNKRTGVYEFYTLEERLQAPIVDMSSNFSRILNENYIVGEYGQENVFKYKYNEDGENHNDGSFDVSNVQLKDKHEIQSKFYGAERDKTFFDSINKILPEFLLWKEEIKETDSGTEITYKELKNHYHWLEINTLTGSFGVSSRGYNTTGTTNTIKLANFDPFKWPNLLSQYYNRIGELVDSMSFLEVEMKLTALEIEEFSFYSRIYIEELGAIFLPNKIIYSPGELSKVELIKISEV